MLPKGLLSKIGGVLSLISLLFLPLVGNWMVTVTGIDILKEAEKWKGEFEIIGPMLVISLLCAIGSFFMKTAPAFFTAGGAGLGGLLIAYMATRSNPFLEFKGGAYLSIIGFGLVLAEGFLQTQTSGTDARDSSGQPPG